MNQMKRFGLDVGWVLISSVANLGIAFLLRIALARWMGSFELGLYTMVITVQETAMLIAGLGISTAQIKYVAEYQGHKDKLLGINSNAFFISLIFGLAAGCLLYFGSSLLADIFKMPELSHLLRILAISIPFYLMLEAELGLINGLRKMKTWAILMIFRNVLMISAIITFVLLGFGAEGTVFGIVIAGIATSLGGLYISKEYIRLALKGVREDVKKLLVFGVQAFGANTVSLIANRADIIMIGYFMTATDVGYYSIAVNMSMLFDVIPHAIQRVTYPATTDYWYKEDYFSLQKMIDKSMKYSASILLPAGLVIGFFAREITIFVFGAEYINSVAAFLVLLISRLLRGATIQPIGSVFSSRGRPDIGLKIDTLTTVLNIGLNIVFITRFGIVGAALATTISLLVGAIIFLILLPRMMNIKIDVTWYVQTLGLTGVAVAIFWLGTRFINPYILGAVVLIGYGITFVKFLFPKEDRNLLGSLARSLIRR